MHTFLGTERDVGKLPVYFAHRHCLIDYRGDLDIDPSAEFGFNVCIYTSTHPADWLLKGEEIITKSIPGPVTIGRRAWICSNAVLFNCTIGEGAIVGLGAVVRSMEVEPYTMVVGNPARPIKKFKAGEWKRFIETSWVTNVLNITSGGDST